MSRRSEWFNFSRWRAWFRRRANLNRRLGDEPALRSELFSADQMERHGRALAAAHRVTRARSRDLLLARLDDNEAVFSAKQLERYKLQVPAAWKACAGCVVQ